MLEGNFIKEKRDKSIGFCEDIDSICKKHTILDESDVALIHKKAVELVDMAKERQRDCFINCVRASGNDTITVAAAYADNSLYNYITIGAIVSDVDEPAVLRTLRYGLPTSEIHAVSYTTRKETALSRTAFL